MEEMRNFVALIEKWNDHSEIGFCSKNVEILFNALYQTNSRICAKAALVQNRIVMDHIAEHWRLMVRAMMTEAEWASSKHIPATMEEYMSAASHSLVGAIFQSAAYLLGSRLPEEVVGGEEGRSASRRVLLPSAAASPASVEAAKVEIGRAIRALRGELQRLVFGDGAGVVPRSCREMFWQTSNVASAFYRDGDGYSPKEMLSVANAVILDPL
uniref:Ent-kaurene synthase B, chloroplast, putative n=1 Tax=Oryza sativa subsp. japonica TaxID=39947 RepID=Q2R4H2_ORYSJ|nr:Ent-kaurene synthase B, chloroplast precursor, putative [Oryza sativa Japonica Group]